MTDERYTFVSDVRDKKRTARGAFNKRTHCGKGGAVKFPSDFMSKKEIKLGGAGMNKIPYIERCAVYRKAIAKYGADKQMTVAIEEMSEVIKELCKLQRGIGNRDHLAEEIADAAIVLEQMRMLFNLNQAVCDKMDEKIERLQRKVAWE